MHLLITILVILLVLLVPALLNTFLLRTWHRPWWGLPWVRYGIWAMFAVGVCILVTIFIMHFQGGDPVNTLLGPGLLAVFLGQIAITITLPVTAVLLIIIKSRKMIFSSTPEKHHRGRRRFLRAAAAAIPMVAATTSVGGVAGSVAGARIRAMDFNFPHLPRHLDGLTIAHITDLHLGGFTPMIHLETTLSGLRKRKTDLILVTGDIADDLRMLPQALQMICGLKPALGVFVVPGNHEYANGIEKFKSIVAQSDATLLANSSVEIIRNGQSFFLAGIDDPKNNKTLTSKQFYAQAVSQTMAGNEAGLFSILMSHRPDVFDSSAAAGADLTLAGHTHGGQLALAGHSIMEVVGKCRYPWGKYGIGAHVLYTSAGAGQWLPFRIGCPPEVPIIRLGKTTD